MQFQRFYLLVMKLKKNLIKLKKQRKMLTEKNYSINLVKINIILKTIRTFGEDIYKGEITFEEADEDQANLVDKINNFVKKTKPKNDKKKQEKGIVRKNLYNFYKGREMVLNAFRSKTFLAESKGSGLLNIVTLNLKY